MPYINFQIWVQNQQVYLFYQLFGCHKVNFAPLTRKQSHYSDVNHTLHLLIKPKGRKEPCTKVQSQTPAEHISKIRFFSKMHFLTI